VASRTTLARFIAATLILWTAVVSVGLTASPEGPFAITVRTVWIHLAVDIDVKLGPHHFHTRWSALPDQPAY
jgi:hypothetical protein